MVEEVLLPEDVIGSYDIEHLRQFWLLQKARNEQTIIVENDKLKEEAGKLQDTIKQLEQEKSDLNSTVDRVTLLEESERKLKDENSELKTKVAEKEHLAAHAQRVQEERDQLQQRVRELERDNSEQQAKILMSAFNTSGSQSNATSLLTGLGNLTSASTLANETSTSVADKDRLQTLERDNSQLTNENLKLQEENQSLSIQLQEQIDVNNPEKREDNQQAIEDEIQERVQKALEDKDAEGESLR